MDSDNGSNCSTGLQARTLDQETFDRELALCKKLSQENGGKCGWGNCADCGVIPLLHKLHKGVLIEDKEEIAKIKLNSLT